MRKTFLLFLFLVIPSSSLFAQEHVWWKFQAKSRIYSSPVIRSNNIYFGSSDSVFYCLEKKTGEVLWTYKTNGQITSQPCVFKESIIFNSTDGSIYSLNKKDGSLLWTYQTNGERRYDLWDYYLSSPVCYDDELFVGSGDSCVYALNASNGALRWKQKTGDVVHATAVIHQDRVLIGSFDGFFYALYRKTGQVIWKFDTMGETYFPKGEVQKGAVVYGETVIFGSRDYNLYALDIATGGLKWKMKEEGSWIIATPLLHQGNLYFGTSDSHSFYCVDAESGAIKWKLSLNMRVFGTAIFWKDDIIFGCFNGKLYGVNPENGIIKFAFQTNQSKRRYNTIYLDDNTFRKDFELYGDNYETSEKMILDLGSILSSPSIEKNILYFGDASGDFYALELK